MVRKLAGTPNLGKEVGNPNSAHPTLHQGFTNQRIPIHQYPSLGIVWDIDNDHSETAIFVKSASETKSPRFVDRFQIFRVPRVNRALGLGGVGDHAASDRLEKISKQWHRFTLYVGSCYL